MIIINANCDWFISKLLRFFNSDSYFSHKIVMIAIFTSFFFWKKNQWFYYFLSLADAISRINIYYIIFLRVYLTAICECDSKISHTLALLTGHNDTTTTIYKNLSFSREYSFKCHWISTKWELEDEKEAKYFFFKCRNLEIKWHKCVCFAVFKCYRTWNK